ncbi:hypothetical protein [Leptospira sp. 'Mane']|uniref:hypothetical protein n=1 Tax=Leptospira sp. 'Mane' TaxID=3387407 RepID=UPI00398B017D
MTEQFFRERINNIKEIYYKFLTEVALDLSSLDYYDILTDQFMKSGFMYEEIHRFHNNMVATECGKFCTETEYLKNAIKYIKEHKTKIIRSKFIYSQDKVLVAA